MLYEIIKHVVIFGGAMLICVACSACTGPFGIVIGDQGIHQKYNERLEITAKGEQEHVTRK